MLPMKHEVTRKEKLIIYYSEKNVNSDKRHDLHQAND